MKNQGEDAFKPEVYGDVIIIERRITESASSTILKDHEGLFALALLFPQRGFFCSYYYETYVLQGKK